MGLLFTGEYGVGKTAAATLVLMAVRKHYAPSLFVNTGELLEAKLTGRRIDDEPMWERAHHQDVLLIDDLGKEGAGRAGPDSEIWDRLLQLRGDRMLTTIITTNLTIEAHEQRYCPSFMERVRESLITAEAEGPNQRLAR